MILIVDDDPSVTASLGLLLKQNGHPSAAARDPQEALALLQQQEFDLVLQDMNFSRDTSGREGLELLNRIRNWLESSTDADRRPTATTATVDSLDTDTRARLRALGYIR